MRANSASVPREAVVNASSVIFASQWPALHSLDLGSVISPDGRDTPLVPTMPVILRPDATAAPTASAAPDDASSSKSVTSAILPGLPDLPPHFGARVVVAIIAVLVIVVVVWRILAPPPGAAAAVLA